MKSNFILAVAALCFAASQALAATYYVGKAGSDANTCAQAQNPATRKLTIHGAISCMSIAPNQAGGNTIVVGSGVYDEAFFDDLPSGSSWSAPFTLKAEERGGAILRPTTGTCDVYDHTGELDSNGTPIQVATGEKNRPCFGILIYRCKDCYILIDGFKLDMSYNAYSGIKIDGASHVTIQHTEVFNPQGVCVLGCASNCKFLHMDVHACAVRDPKYHCWPGSGCGSNSFYLGGNNIEVAYSRVYGGGLGIAFYGGNANTHSNTAHHNIVYGGIGIFQAYGGGNAFFHDNLVIGGGISTDGNARIFNNTILGPTRAAIQSPGYDFGISAGGSGNEVRNNIIWGPFAAGPLSGNAAYSNNLCAGNPNCAVQSDPLFVSGATAWNYPTADLFISPLNIPSTLDYHLKNGSPAINTGTNLFSSGVTTDLDGLLRPVSGAFEIGAYEFASGTQVANAAPAKVRGLRWR